MLCRDLGHVWRPHRVERIARNWRRTLRCRTCGCEREQMLNSFGAPISNRYSYPEKYLVAGGFSTSDRSALRLRQVVRMAEEADRG